MAVCQDLELHGSPSAEQQLTAMQQVNNSALMSIQLDSLPSPKQGR
jgi:hypothetical protein